MSAQLEQFLAEVRASLDLPARKADLLVEELRSHLLADYEERVKVGKSEEEAAREAIEEVGDPKTLARAWEVEQAEARFSPSARNFAAGLFSIVGFMGVLSFSDRHVLYRLSGSLDRVASLPPGLGSFSATTGTHWLLRHVDPNAVEALLSVLPLLLLGLVVARLSRRRWWLLALVPWALIWGITAQMLVAGKLKTITDFPGPHPHLWYPLAEGAALLAGSWLGRRLSILPPRTSRIVLRTSFCVVSFLMLYAWVENVADLLALARIVLEIGVIGGLAWGASTWWRRRSNQRTAEGLS